MNGEVCQLKEQDNRPLKPLNRLFGQIASEPTLPHSCRENVSSHTDLNPIICRNFPAIPLKTPSVKELERQELSQDLAWTRFLSIGFPEDPRWLTCCKRGKVDRFLIPEPTPSLELLRIHEQHTNGLKWNANAVCWLAKLLSVDLHCVRMCFQSTEYLGCSSLQNRQSFFYIVRLKLPHTFVVKQLWHTVV